MKKEMYLEPELELVRVDADDIVTNSSIIILPDDDLE